MSETRRYRIKSNWMEGGRKCELLCFVEHELLRQRWAVVIWDGEDEPDLFKAAGLEVDDE